MFTNPIQNILDPVITADPPDTAKIPDLPQTPVQAFMKEFKKDAKSPQLVSSCLQRLMASIYQFVLTGNPTIDDVTQLGELLASVLKSHGKEGSAIVLPDSGNDGERIEAAITALQWGSSAAGVEPAAMDQARYRAAVALGLMKDTTSLPGQNIATVLNKQVVSCLLACRTYDTRLLKAEFQNRSKGTPADVIMSLGPSGYVKAVTELLNGGTAVTIGSKPVAIDLVPALVNDVVPRGARLDDIDFFLTALRASPLATSRFIVQANARAAYKQMGLAQSELVARLRESGYRGLTMNLIGPSNDANYPIPRMSQPERVRRNSAVHDNARLARTLCRHGTLVLGGLDAAFDVFRTKSGDRLRFPSPSRRREASFWYLLSEIHFGGKTYLKDQPPPDVTVRWFSLEKEEEATYRLTLNDFCDHWCGFVYVKP